MGHLKQKIGSICPQQFILISKFARQEIFVGEKTLVIISWFLKVYDLRHLRYNIGCKKNKTFVTKHILAHARGFSCLYEQEAC